MTPTVLHGERVTLRPITEDDLPRLFEIVRERSVARWWGSRDDGLLRDDLMPDPGAGFVVVADGETTGWIGCAEQSDPDYRHASIDLFLGGAWQGRGFGTDALRTLARHLFDECGHHRLTIDPAVENERAIHVYEQVGFRPVGVMRAYERRGGRWGDNLLMDMLRSDLEGGA